jgi:hypothetical protein
VKGMKTQLNEYAKMRNTIIKAKANLLEAGNDSSGSSDYKRYKKNLPTLQKMPSKRNLKELLGKGIKQLFIKKEDSFDFVENTDLDIKQLETQSKSINKEILKEVKRA